MLTDIRLNVLATIAIAVAAIAVASAAGPAVKYDHGTGLVILTNGRLELRIETRQGLNPRELRDLKSGRELTDGDYVWPGGRPLPMFGAPVIDSRGDGASSVTLKGKLGELVVEQSFTAPADQPGVIIERLTLANPTAQEVAATEFKCGFAKRIREGDKWLNDSNAVRVCPIPYRRETDGRLMEAPLRAVAEHGMSYRYWMDTPVETPTWGSEGWTWSDNASTLVVSKYNTDEMEWSLMDPVRRGADTFVRFGGAGQWKYGLPPGVAHIAPGKSLHFGETWLRVVDGDWKQGYYAYRRYMESQGDGVHAGYNPPVHWNEIYDNRYYWAIFVLPWWDKQADPPALVANRSLLKLLYTLDDMKGEAAKAKEIGAETLYLDPGWDTGLGEHIWGADRLGSMDSFVKMLRDEYGLKLGLWISLGNVPPTYGDPDACPPDAKVVDFRGHRTDMQCFASPAFLNTKTERLLELCRHGVSFLMFDSTTYSGPCYDKSHGHSIPSTREEHAKALFELAHRVKRQYPDVLIEMHDPVSGPTGNHYTPTYFGYAEPNSFDCLWAHEFMTVEMKYLLDGKALSLYYYNLAYSIPFYLHIDLRNDNQNALEFWWYASTIRHLGIGAKNRDPQIWAAHKEAMRTYLSLKRFYTQGSFYGLDEMVHAHTLPDLKASVIDCFNLGDTSAEKEVRFHLPDIGLSAGKVEIEGAPFTVKGDEINLTVPIPAKGHRLVKVRVEPN